MQAVGFRPVSGRMDPRHIVADEFRKRAAALFAVNRHHAKGNPHGPQRLATVLRMNGLPQVRPKMRRVSPAQEIAECPVADALAGPKAARQRPEVFAVVFQTAKPRRASGHSE